MRTPHLRTDLSAREVATAVREAADLIDALNEDLRKSNGLVAHKDGLILEQAEEIRRLKACVGMVTYRKYIEQEAELKAKKEHILDRYETIRQLQAETAALTEQVLQQARTIERYQRKYPEGV